MTGKRMVLTTTVFLAMLTILLLASSDHKAYATPTTYYVSFSGGSDSNNGTSSSTPWKTLTKASGVTLNAGDSLLLKAGDTWTGDTLLPQGAGTSVSPILISSYGAGAKPHIAPGIGVKTYAIRLVGVAGYKITNLEISDTYGGIVAWYDQSYNHDYLWIENVDFHDITGKDTGFTTPNSGGYPTPAVDLYYGAGISLAGADGIGNQTFLSDITIKNDTFIRCDDGIFMLPRDATSYTIQNKSLITANAFKNLNISNVTVQKSYTSAGIDIYCTTGGTFDNIMIDETGYLVGMWWGTAGLQFSRSTNITVQNSEFKRTYRPNSSPDGEGIDFEGDNHDITVKNSSIHDNEGPGIMFFGQSVWTGNNVNMTVDTINSSNNNSTQFTGNIAFKVSANNTGSIIKNSNLFLQNDSQTYNTSPITFDSSNNVWNSAVLVANDNTTGTGNNQFDYQGGTWSYGTPSLGDPCIGCLSSDEHWSNTTNAYYLVRFNGTQIQVRNGRGPSDGIAAFSIDGGTESTVDMYNSTSQENVLTYTSPTLTSGAHTLKVRVTGTKNASAIDYNIGSDIAAITTGGSAPAVVGLNTPGSNTETTSANYFEAVKATAGSNLTVTSLNLYVSSGASGSVRLGIYSDSSGSPGTKLAETSAITLANGWNTGTISSTSLTSGTQYWLVFDLSATGSVLTYNTLSGGNKYVSYSYPTSLPATAPGSLTSGSGTYAIYASGTSSSTHVGLDTAGSNTETTSANYFEAVKATAGSNVTVTNLNLYVSSGATGSVRLGIYSDSSGSPGTKLAETSAITLANGWNTGTISSTSLTSGTQYWLVFDLSATGSVLTYNTLTGGNKYVSYSYPTSLPATAPGSLTSGVGTYAIYASN